LNVSGKEIASAANGSETSHVSLHSLVKAIIQICGPSRTAKIKASTRWAFQKASTLYFFDQSDLTNRSKEIVSQLSTRFTLLGRTQPHDRRSGACHLGSGLVAESVQRSLLKDAHSFWLLQLDISPSIY
jgi:hypothetical protein